MTPLDERPPAEVYTLAIGLTLVAAGILGFFYDASFATGDGAHREAALGLFDVDGWSNVLHIVSGATGLFLVGSYAGSRAYALGAGVLYLAIAALGFVAGSGDAILDMVPVNTADNFLHLLIGLAGLGAGLATPRREPDLAMARPASV